MVELTLITPLLLIALYVPADFGIAFFTAHLTQNAVREGARIGSALPTWDQTLVESEVTNRLPTLLGGPPTVTVTLSGTANSTCMRTVSVTATGTYDFGLYRLMNLFGFSAPPNMTITREAEMRYDYQSNLYSTPC